MASMAEEAMISTPTSAGASSATPRRTRLSRKRTRFTVVPKMPQPVKALWEQASAEEKSRAHRTCSVMLQHWLGRISRTQAAEELQLAPLRVWQLSQQALAGMVAGLLKQPRARKQGGETMPLHRDEDPKWLKQQIHDLERKLKIAQDVIALLREMPAQQARRSVTKAEKPRGQKSAGAAAAASTGEEKQGIPGRKRKRPGMRKPTAPLHPRASEDLADGERTNPAS